MKKYNKEIKRIRALLQLSQGEFAAELARTEGIHLRPTAISNYENGDRHPLPTIGCAIVRYARLRGIETSLDQIYKRKLNNQNTL